MAFFRLIDDKEEFLDSYSKLLALRLLTGITTRIPCTFERNLLAEFKSICGPFFVKSFEKMFSDLNENEKELSSSVTVLTGGTWNIRGKLLPGHSALLSSNNEQEFNWPPPVEKEISVKSKIYNQKYPKRKLFWSPLLTSIEFNYVLGEGSISIDLMIKGSCLHLNILQLISESKIDIEGLIKLLGSFSINCINSLLLTGLIIKSNDGFLFINQDYKQEAKELNLYDLTLTDLLSTGTSKNGHGNGNIQSNQSSSSTPLSSSNYFSNNNNNNSNNQLQLQISPIDKSILLQCAITRILKQLRVLSLSNLFDRISMLPKLLTRFSPTLKDLLDVLKQLHEKEFIKLALGDGIDDLIDVKDDDLVEIDNYNQSTIFIKYLA